MNPSGHNLARLILATVLCSGIAFGANYYTVVALGSLDGSGRADAVAINNNGQVVGTTGVGGLNHAFLWTAQAGMSDLGAFGGIASFGYAINDGGAIVGYFVDGANHMHGFVYSGGSVTDIEADVKAKFGGWTGANSGANSINNSGLVVGEYMTNDYSQAYGYMWVGGSITSLGTLDGDASQVVDVNDSGMYAGTSYAHSEFHQYVFIGSGGSFSQIVPPNSTANAINNVGQVVGYYSSDTGRRAFLYTGGDVVTLPLVGDGYDEARAINNLGQIVGRGGVLGVYHAFLYKDGQIRDLNTLIDPSLKIVLASATAINDSGQIIAQTSEGKSYLLNPPVVKYTAGDVFPSTSDAAPNFGDSALDVRDLVQLLFAVNNVTGFKPAACSDRFDAMDVFPLDTDTTRGGDGVLDIRDLVGELFRVNNIDTTRPARTPKSGTCTSQSPAGAGGLLADRGQ
jgi:probable HAF family extracellular repeat protein